MSDDVLRVKDQLRIARLEEEVTALAVRRARAAHGRARKKLRALEQAHAGVAQLGLFAGAPSCDGCAGQ